MAPTTTTARSKSAAGTNGASSSSTAFGLGWVYELILQCSALVCGTLDTGMTLKFTVAVTVPTVNFERRIVIMHFPPPKGVCAECGRLKYLFNLFRRGTYFCALPL